MKAKSQERTANPAAGAGNDKATTPHSAPGAAAGFTYQFGRALWWLATKSGDFSVAVETLDDICIEDADGSTTLEQDKFSIRDAGHPVSDRAVALWKTLANWLGMFNTANGEYCCLLVTNRPVPAESLVKRLSDAETDAAVEAVVAEIHEVAANPAEAIRPYAEAVRGASRDLLARLVAAVRLASSDCAGTEWADLREAALGSLHLPTSMQTHASSLLDELLGWLVHCCMQAWHDGFPATITSQAFNNAYHRAIERRRRQQTRERPPNLVRLAQEDIDGQSRSTYVRQLTLVDAEQGELDQAILDCVRYGKEVLRLTNTGEYTPQDWDDFETELEQRWQRIFLRSQRLHVAEDECRRGYRVYHETTDDYLARLRGQETDHQYFSAGAYHRLADELDVGWHPRFRELLTEGGDNGTQV